MAIYTDGIHLMADTPMELHTFALKIDIDQKWFVNQRYKYYILLGKVESAIMNGAIVIDTRDLVRKFKPL